MKLSKSEAPTTRSLLSAILTIFALAVPSNLVYASSPLSPSAALFADPPSTTTLYLRSSTDAAGGQKVLSQDSGPTNCNIQGSKCISEAYVCANPFVVPCPDGLAKDFTSPGLTGALKITMVAYTIFIMNNNRLVTLNFKLAFTLTKNGDKIYSQTSDLLSLNASKSASFGVVAPGNAVPDANQSFAQGDKIDCSVNVVSVQDSNRAARSAADLSLIYNGKVDSGADSRCTIITNVCPGFAQSGTLIGGDQISCPLPAVPEFNAPAALVAVMAFVLLLFFMGKSRFGSAPRGKLPR